MADSSLSDKILGSFWGRFFIVILQTVLISQLLLLTFLVRLYVNIALLKYIVVLLVGLLAGFSTRRFLTAHTRVLQLLAALISTALSLASLYILSAGFIGINLFYRSNNRPDWQGLIQFGLAALGSLLVINAFRTRSAPQEVHTAPAVTAPQPKTEAKRWVPKFALPTLKKSEPKITKIAPAKKERVSAKKSTTKKASNTLAIQKTAAKPKKLAVVAAPKPKTKKATRKAKKNVNPEIKFVGKEEHTCPYCLDPVENHDPRGVKICTICNTRHHADCWGITGACQIPHSNEKKKH
jgi:hypothetical protein